MSNALAPATSKANAKAPAKTTAAPKAKTLLNVSGNGIKETTSFTTGDEWNVSYSYDCTAFGSEGNFAVLVYAKGGDVEGAAANVLGKKGTDVSVQHGSGPHYLSVNSECKWQIKVTG